MWGGKGCGGCGKGYDSGSGYDSSAFAISRDPGG
jgi:hypothetical protein